ncbi:alginate O-acetyltransferase AlgX-related protein [Deinococcus pimensis]|uniref:alginate O-acetyltransferase AlgX-related protein n=1 Tax=Deinococcus pimensis TaxID=309888 RepID=UPI0004BC21BC|nr:hypothetical protein [Deinococcus pimensis]
MSEFAKDTLSAPRPRGSWGLRYLPGAFLLACVTLGLPMTLWPAPTRELPRGRDVVTGDWAKAFETTLDRNLPLREAGVRVWAEIGYGLFREGRPGVLVGQDGWLYTSEEFQRPPDAGRELARKVDYVRAVDRQLRARGVRLLVTLVPAKARVYPEHLGRYRVPRAVDADLGRFAGALDRAGVANVNLAGPFLAAKTSGALFLRTDTHWTPLGARVAARAVAAETRRRWPDLGLAPGEFRTATGPAVNREGDLTRFLPVSPAHLPAPDVVRAPKTERTDAGGGLLGDPVISATLVGTSYSANATWNFDGALREALGADVVNEAREGQGPMVPMRSFLRGKAATNPDLRLVIWELPERFLTVPYPNAGS